MLLDQRHGMRVSQRLLELGRTDDVCEKQRHQTRAVTTPKVFDLCVISRCPTLIHDVGVISNPHARAETELDIQEKISVFWTSKTASDVT